MQSQWARVLVGSLVAIVAAGGSHAGDDAKLSDRDGDGKIQWNDVAGIAATVGPQELAAVDENGDGVITTAEFAKAARSAGLKRILAWADADGDGAVSEEEWNAVAQDLPKGTFQGLDTNKDGKIKKGDAVPGAGQGRRQAGGKAEGTKGGKGQQQTATPKADADAKPAGKPARDGKGARTPQDRAVTRDKMISDADADKDGRVTLEDVQKVKPGLPERAFKNLDTNNDGVLSAEDAAGPGKQGARKGKPDAAARQQHRQRMKAADTDGDGKLSREEAKKAFPQMTDEAFGKRDTNGDGFIGPEDRKGKGGGRQQ